MSDKVTLTSLFNSYKSDSDTISADDLTDVINELLERELSAKTVRAYLRKAMRANEIDSENVTQHQKNARWQIDKVTATSAVKHFDRAQRTA